MKKLHLKKSNIELIDAFKMGGAVALFVFMIAVMLKIAIASAGFIKDFADTEVGMFGDILSFMAYPIGVMIFSFSIGFIVYAMNSDDVSRNRK